MHVLHVVFRNFFPHGDFYLYVSDWLFKWSQIRRHSLLRKSGSKKVFVGSAPHGMAAISLTGSNFRDRLAIPVDAFVIGRIGGYRSFDDRAAHHAVLQVLAENPQVYFLAVNTDFFGHHPRLIYRDYVDRSEISDFYDACDLLLNGRLMGESFGFSVAEPLAHGKPILAPHWLRNPRMDWHHLSLLKGSGLLYRNRSDLLDKIKAFANGKEIPVSELESRVSSFTISRLATTLFHLSGGKNDEIATRKAGLEGYLAKSAL